MKKILILLLSVSLNIGACDYSIVFVHIGDSLPEYLSDAIHQACLFNPKNTVYLVGNRSALENKQRQAPYRDINLVFCEELEQSFYHLTFMQASPLDNSFRDGFWKKASERFFYLEELVSQRNLGNVIHLESDVMIYVSIGEILPTLKQYRTIAAVFDNDTRCIPSFMYFPDVQSLSHLVSYFAELAPRGLNDMEVIGLYKRAHGQTRIRQLPIIMEEYVTDHGLQSVLGQKTESPQCFYNQLKEFSSIFDAAAIGQFLGGIDPRNGESKPGFVNESCLFNPALLKFEWTNDTRGRNIPYVVYKAQKYRINNLHIHCKNLEKFMSDTKEEKTDD